MTTGVAAASTENVFFLTAVSKPVWNVLALRAVVVRAGAAGVPFRVSVEVVLCVGTDGRFCPTFMVFSPLGNGAQREKVKTPLALRLSRRPEWSFPPRGRAIQRS